MIKVNRIIPQTVEAFDPDGNSLGFLNEYEFNDLRVQIKQEKAEGYYMVFNDKRNYIDVNGRLKDWEVGFYDMIENQLIELL